MEVRRLIVFAVCAHQNCVACSALLPVGGATAEAQQEDEEPQHQELQRIDSEFSQIEQMEQIAMEEIIRQVKMPKVQFVSFVPETANDSSSWFLAIQLTISILCLYLLIDRAFYGPCPTNPCFYPFSSSSNC